MFRTTPPQGAPPGAPSDSPAPRRLTLGMALGSTVLGNEIEMENLSPFPNLVLTQERSSSEIEVG